MLSNHWKAEILVQGLPLYQQESDTVIGMYHDPAEFIPNHMARWLKRLDMEGTLPPAGFYAVKFKVSLALFLMIGRAEFNFTRINVWPQNEDSLRNKG